MKRPAGKEMRSRTGCRKCRERRVKCSEQRPICRHCQRLGFICSYETKLTWQEVSTWEPEQRWSRVTLSNLVQSWMFLNVVYGDFDNALISDKRSETPSHSSSDSSSEAPLVLRQSASPRHFPDAITHGHILQSPPISLSPLRLTATESYLWDYFDRCMTPQCVLADINPYRDVLLRVASASRETALFQCIMAVSASQLHCIGRSEFALTMWQRRERALRQLRSQVTLLADQQLRQTGPSVQECEIVGSTVMLCFFEISQDCSDSWMTHSTFGCEILSSRLHMLDQLSLDQQCLYRFAATYFAAHDILASTAGTEISSLDLTTTLCSNADASSIASLTGCSKDLLLCICAINRMQPSRSDHDQCTAVRQSRDDIERHLHRAAQQIPDELESSHGESILVFEAKRLAALLYLYSRVDGATPQEPHIIRLTSQILNLLPRISLRTHTVLWPLFIVATLGIRAECDDDRKLVLEILAALQGTRQLGSVKRARTLIEDVWKARDLHPGESTRGWSILEGRGSAVSLA